MSEVAIFAYGLAVFLIVGTACALIIWGLVEVNRETKRLDSSGTSVPGPPMRTDASGRTSQQPDAAVAQGEKGSG